MILISSVILFYLTFFFYLDTLTSNEMRMFRNRRRYFFILYFHKCFSTSFWFESKIFHSTVNNYQKQTKETMTRLFGPNNPNTKPIINLTSNNSKLMVRFISVDKSKSRKLCVFTNTKSIDKIVNSFFPRFFFVFSDCIDRQRRSTKWKKYNSVDYEN